MRAGACAYSAHPLTLHCRLVVCEHEGSFAMAPFFNLMNKA